MIVRICWRRRKRVFIYPASLRPPPRTAVLVPCYRSNGTVRVFPEGWGEEAEKFAPGAVAATLPQLEALARSQIPSLHHAVIVLERRGNPLLTEAHRERLWDAFRVPIFEQIIADDGELLATDCEAHEGLHIESPLLRVSRDLIDSTPCPCGRSTPRLVPAENASLWGGVHSARRFQSAH